MKKFINNPQNVVEEMIDGLGQIYPNLARLAGYKVLLRSDINFPSSPNVALISGGGSGHEPAHAGFIGRGMLTAAVAGEVFTSPSADSVLAAIRAVAGPKGVLLIVKNYTGDCLNFGFAAETARAEGIRVQTVTVADDVALATTHTRPRRRGIAGTVLVHKIAGAAADLGMSLDEVSTLAQSVADDIASMGVSLSAGIVPAVGKPGYELREDELELGLGIHGEPGVKRMRMRTADELADELIENMLQAKPLHKGDRVAALINNLGATTGMELAIFARRVLAILRGQGVSVERVFTGTFVSSLEAAGLSVSLLPLDDSRLRFIDAATSAPAWPNATPSTPEPRTISIASSDQPQPIRPIPNTRFVRCIRAACAAVRAARDRLTELDAATGDGDLGISLERGADAIEASLAQFPCEHTGRTLKQIGTTLQRAMGGSSGPLYGVFFVRGGSALESGMTWGSAMLAACRAVCELGGANEGDRTMLDALIPAAHALIEGVDFATAAELGAERTANMLPRVGRSTYLGDRVKGHPDPGAVAAATWLRAVALELDFLEPQRA